MILKCPYAIGIGFNCTEPKYISKLFKIVQEINKHNTKKKKKKHFIVYPNSGEEFDAEKDKWVKEKKEDIDKRFVEYSKEWKEQFGVEIIGGCCRTTPKTISMLVHALGSGNINEKQIAHKLSKL